MVYLQGFLLKLMFCKRFLLESRVRKIMFTLFGCVYACLTNAGAF